MLKEKNINFKWRWAVAGLSALAFAVVVPLASAVAYGPTDRPTYKMEAPADHVTFNSITNNNVYGDERNFVRVREAGTTGWVNEIKVTAGKEYEVLTYYHNNAASNLNGSSAGGVGIAINARLWSVFPNKVNKSAKAAVKSYVYADNASPKKVWDEAYFTTDSTTDITFRYLANTAKIHNGGKLNNTTLGLQLFSATGSDAENGILLGYNSQSGKLYGCSEFSGYVIYTIRAEQANATVKKTVSLNGKDYYDNVTAKPGDTVTYKVVFKNTGSKDLTNATFRDKLPTGVTLVSGSAKMTSSTGGSLSVSDEVVNKGSNVGGIKEGVTFTLTYKVKLNTNIVANGKCGTNSFKNTINVTTDQTGTKTGSATIKVEKACATENPNFTIDKAVQKKGDSKWVDSIDVKPTDEVVFRLTFKNTGNVALPNVVLRDVLPEGLLYKSGSSTLTLTTSDGKTSTKTLADGVTTSKGVNIGEIPVGMTATVHFNATFTAVLKAACEASTLKNTAKATYKNDNDTAKEDGATVKVAAGKDCKEPEEYDFTLAKTAQVKGETKWVETATAKAGDTVRFRIAFKNTGNVTLKDVTLVDTLPSGLTYVKGSTTVAFAIPNKTDAGEKKLADGITTTKGVVIGNVAAGETASVYFEAKVDSSFADSCEAKTLTNKVRAFYGNNSKVVKEDTAKVKIAAGKSCEPEDKCHDEYGNLLKSCCDYEEYKDEEICQEPEDPTPPEMPTTGPGEIALAIMAVVCVATGGIYLYRSQQEVNSLQKRVKGHHKTKK